MKNIILRAIMLCIVHCALNSHANSIIDRINDGVYETKMRALYYKPYAITGSLVGAGLLMGNKLSYGLFAAGGIYSLYAWYAGFKEVRAIELKYARESRVTSHWNNRPSERKPFLFGRWRQQDDQFGDGIYWPTTWWLKEHEQEVKKMLIKDIYSNRIVLMQDEKSIELPNPEQVLQALNKEINELKQDKEALKKYTDVYRRFDCAEAVLQDSQFPIFWPNYNRASRVYIDVIQMLNRLETLRDIIANMKITIGGHGWPQLR